jgi:ferric-dicitrate binding protein FerR (iron transport regulator)
MNTDLLNRYFQGKSSPEEVLMINEWLRTAEGEKYLSAKIDEDIAKANAGEVAQEDVHVDSEKLFSRIMAARAESENKLPSDTESKSPIKIQAPVQRKVRLLQPWVRYAAMLTGLVLLVFALWFSQQTNQIIEQTGFGETKTIMLPDKSTVMLNGNTRLSYTNNWKSGQTREVWLEGEAFFSVTHLSAHQKFLVHTSDNFNVEVLGTTFNVLKRENTIKVILNTGKIKLNINESEDHKEQLFMNPGELVEFDKVSAKYSKRKVNPDTHSSWKVKKMVFENTSLSEIKYMLENTYGLEVQISDPALLEQKLNGTIPNENVDVLLDGLSHLFNLKITKANNLVTIDSE